MSVLDHVALLVEDVEAAAPRVAALGLEAGPIERFPGEGTVEQYHGGEDCDARLLLIQPAHEESPYARALRKRGPGLHHVALRHPEPEDYALELAGWLLHPQSLRSREHGTLWLARPGIGCLLEVARSDLPAQSERALEGVEVEAAAGLASLLAGLRVAGLSAGAAGEGSWLLGAGQRLAAALPAL